MDGPPKSGDFYSAVLVLSFGPWNKGNLQKMPPLLTFLLHFSSTPHPLMGRGAMGCPFMWSLYFFSFSSTFASSCSGKMTPSPLSSTESLALFLPIFIHASLVFSPLRLLRVLCAVTLLCPLVHYPLHEFFQSVFGFFSLLDKAACPVVTYLNFILLREWCLFPLSKHVRRVFLGF